jgi:hypothetical protein
MKLENVLMLGHLDVVLARKKHLAFLHDGEILCTALVGDLEPIAISTDRGNDAVARHTHGSRFIDQSGAIAGLELTLLEPPRIAVIELHLERATRLVVFE